MIRSKHLNQSPGFMLTEVLLALAIIGIVLTSLFSLQSTVLTRIAGTSGKIIRFLAAENFLIDTRQKLLAQESGQMTQEKKITDPAAMIRYQAKNIIQEGYFKKTPGIVQEEMEITWKDGRSTRSEFIVTLLYKPEKKSKKTQTA